MPQLSFANLAICLSIAFSSRLLLGLVPRVRLPGEVVEIALGIILGPAVLGWVEVDEPVKILALVGLAFTLYLAGLELDLSRLRGSLLRVAGAAMAVSAGLAVVVSVLLSAVGLIADARLVAVALCATSLGLVVPVTKQAGFEDRQLGQLVIAGATLGDFGAIIPGAANWPHSPGVLPLPVVNTSARVRPYLSWPWVWRMTSIPKTNADAACFARLP